MPGAGYSSLEEALIKHGRIVYPNKGKSMLPLLREGRDLAVIDARPTDKDGKPLRCRKYQAVLYKRGNRYILHRILKVLPQGYVICGDNNYTREYNVLDGQIIGVLAGVVRDGAEIPVTAFKYRLYVHLWCDLFPLRAGILRLKALFHDIKAKYTKNL